MQTSERKAPKSNGTPTWAHEPAPEKKAAAAPAAPEKLPLPDGVSTFINVLITPKLTFALQRKAQWRTAEDIPQDELAEAFLARFPVRFDPPSLEFKCATPALPLHTADRLVYRIGAANGGDDERVLLKILSSLDKAYAAKYEAKYEQQLEEARADMMSSSYSFQVVADEVRAGQQAAQKRWEREVQSLKEQMSINQKRLFLLEKEKEGIMKAQQVRRTRMATTTGHTDIWLPQRLTRLVARLSVCHISCKADATAAPACMCVRCTGVRGAHGPATQHRQRAP